MDQTVHYQIHTSKFDMTHQVLLFEGTNWAVNSQLEMGDEKYPNPLSNQKSTH